MRLPHQPGGGESIGKEAHWTSNLGNGLPITVDDIVEMGAPAMAHPKQWCIVRLPPGQILQYQTPTGLRFGEITRRTNGCFPEDFGHQEAQSESSLSRHYRGNPLYRHDCRSPENLASCMAMSELDLDLDSALGIWEEAMPPLGGGDCDDDLSVRLEHDARSCP